jgi:ABC-type bacteriocin/lantibiotic exporter with double-glycine peptidase domain
VFFNYFYRNISFLSKKEKNIFYSLILLQLIATIIELIGIGVFIPLIDFFFKKENFLIEKFVFFFEISNKENIFVILIALLFLFFILKNIFLFSVNLYQNYFLKILRCRITIDLYKKYIYQSYSYHLNKGSPLLFRNIQNVTTLVDVMQCYFVVILELILLFLILAALLYSSFYSTVIICIFTFIVSFFVFNFNKKKFLNWGKIQAEKELESSKLLLNSFNSIKEIKILNKEQYVIKLFASVANNLASLNFYINSFLQLPRFIFELFLIFSVIISFIFLYYQNSDLASIASTLSIFVLAAIRLVPGVTRLVNHLQRIIISRSMKNLILEEMKILYPENKNTNIIKLNFEKLDVKNINFNFTDRQLLKNINFTLNKGECIGILGPSGSGKSTLLNIITGLLQPNSGSIKINSFNIEHVVTKWQKAIGYVPQSVFIVDASFKDNVCLFDEIDFDEQRFNNAISLSKLENLIKNLPNGIETLVGEKGKLLSGGEIQRLGIARALYLNPDVLIFDESTNALDEKLEKEIMNDIKYLKKIKTIIIISHNFKNIDFFDKVIKL